VESDGLLVIDPQLIFSTYSGSTTDNFGYTATYDQEGYLYSGSSAFGQGYPTTLGAYQTTWAGGDGSFTLPGTDVALSKYDVTGTFMVWSTFIGGAGDELPHSLVVNANNELIAYGSTGSDNFPCSVNALDSSFNGGAAFTPQGVGTTYANGCDAFITQLNANGSSLLMSTYFGGSGNDGVNTASGLKFNYADEFRGEVDLDDNGNVYIIGTTNSQDFPLFNSSENGGGMQDVFILKFSPLWELLLSRKLGGSDDESGCSVGVKDGEVWICGGTQSSDFPVSIGAYQTLFAGGSSDGWVARLSSSGLNEFATYWGSPAYEQWYFIDLNNSLQPFVYGQSTANGATWISNVGWSQTNSGMVVAQFSEDLATLEHSTVFGSGTGLPNLSPAAFMVDVCGQIYLSGWGGAVNQGSNAQTGNTQNLWTSPNAFQSTTNGSDFYLLVIKDDFSAPVYGTYYGGAQSAEHVDGGTSRFDRKGIIYQSVCAGCGNHDDFPIFPSNAVSPVNASNNCNNGVFKFDFELPLTYVQPQFVFEACVGEQIEFSASYQNVQYWLWQDDQGNVLHNGNSFSASFNVPGDYYVSLIGIDSTTCNVSDSAGHWIHIVGPQVSTMESTSLCLGDSIWVGLNAPESGVEYSWQSNDFITQDTLPATLYFGTVSASLTLLSDHGLCTDTTYFPIEVVNVELNLPGDSAFCAAQVVDVYAEIQPSNADVQWFWNNPNSNALGNGIDLAYNLAQSGWLYAEATLNNCRSLDSMQFQLFSLDENVLQNPTVCNEDSVWIGVINPIPAVSYNWQANDNIFTSLQSPSIYVNGSISGQYILTSSLDLCQKNDTVDVTVSSLSGASLNLQLSPSPVISGQTIELTAQPSGFEYQFNPNNWIIDQNENMASGIPSQSTWIEVVWMDGLCTRTDSVWLEVVDFECGDPYLFIPNTFSPNHDGHNDVLFVYGNFGQTFQWQINDRWGNMVFYSEDVQEGWDGKWKGKTVEQGVYHYYLNWRCEDGRVWQKEGNITVQF
jgi:gliding motility-associated-like protein